jgi:hypothetical protein
MMPTIIVILDRLSSRSLQQCPNADAFTAFGSFSIGCRRQWQAGI